jgi:hypothetical protein
MLALLIGLLARDRVRDGEELNGLGKIWLKHDVFLIIIVIITGSIISSSTTRGSS